MKKKDKAAQAIKKEFKKQMDLTKNMGEEPEKPAVKVAESAIIKMACPIAKAKMSQLAWPIE